MNLRRIAPFFLLLFFVRTGFAAYSYYYNDSLTSINTTYWGQNGSVTATTGGLVSSDSNGGSLISKVAVPGGVSLYEIRAIISLSASGGTFVFYLNASPDALSGPTTSSGTYYAWEFQQPTFSGSSCTAQLVGYKRVSGVITVLSSNAVPCRNQMEVRVVRSNALCAYLCVYIDGIRWADLNENSITSGMPGVGVRGELSVRLLKAVPGCFEKRC